MPNGVARVYPASGAVAMLPLTPANNYTPTLLFCGGSNTSSYNYGGYAGPNADMWTIPASNDCQRLTPEPQDGSAPVYVQDDDMLEERTMGQFILLPDGKMLVINGGLNGTAGYATGTKNTPEYLMPFGVSLASAPVLTPALYDPNAPAGSRWTNQGLSASQIPRLYHSTAILLPDASVLIAGSNPNPDVNLTTYFPTEYRAEIFYPPYFNSPLRPVPTGMPSTLSYGGNPFDITIPSTSYNGSANDAADATQVVVIRGGFTTHAMNMGQRFMQLNNTYTVNQNGSITLHVAQPPPNSNLFQPGPALMFVTVSGVPSNGSYVIIGNGQVGTQPTAPPSVLPASVRLDSVSGGSNSGNGTTTPEAQSSTKTSHVAAIVGGIAGAVAILALLAGVVLFFSRRRRAAARAAARAAPSAQYSGLARGDGATDDSAMTTFKGPLPAWADKSEGRDSSVFAPLKAPYDDVWDPSTAAIHAPYKDGEFSGRPSSLASRPSTFDDYDAYSGYPAQAHAGTPERYPTPQPSQQFGGSR